MRLRPLSLFYRGATIAALGTAGLSAVALVVHAPAVAAVPLAIGAYRRWKRRHGPGDQFGSARPGSFADLVAAGQVGGDSGLYFGTAGYTPPPTKAEGLAALLNPTVDSDLALRVFFSGCLGSPLACRSFIRIDDFCHGAVIAATGAGKGIFFIIPNALAYPDSLAINDPQGSVYTATARLRARSGVASASMPSTCWGRAAIPSTRSSACRRRAPPTCSTPAAKPRTCWCFARGPKPIPTGITAAKTV